MGFLPCSRLRRKSGFYMGLFGIFATKDWVFLVGIWRELGFDPIDLKEVKISILAPRDFARKTKN